MKKLMGSFIVLTDAQNCKCMINVNHIYRIIELDRYDTSQSLCRSDVAGVGFNLFVRESLSTIRRRINALDTANAKRQEAEEADDKKEQHGTQTT